MKKERKKFTKVLEREWKFGDPALVRGLKYDAMKDTFTALLSYRTKTNEGAIEEKEEKMVVSEEWIKAAKYAEGVVQHVINLGNLNNEFVPVPHGRTILLQNKKVLQLRYVHSHTRWTVDPHARPPRRMVSRGKAGKRMIQVTEPGNWEVLLRGETEPIRNDDTFVDNFKNHSLMRLSECGTDLLTSQWAISKYHICNNIRTCRYMQVHLGYILYRRMAKTSVFQRH
jgi:hypothetical protein